MPGYSCYSKSVPVSDVVSYDTEISDILITKGIDDVISCDDLCTADTCKTKTGSNNEVPIAGKKLKDFYATYCQVSGIATTGVASRSSSTVRLNIANSNNPAYQHDANVCDLKCADSGLCKLTASSPIDLTQLTVRQYIAAKNQGIDASKVSSCKIVRKPVEKIEALRSADEVENACVKPMGVVLANKYTREKAQYYDLDPKPRNDVKLVKENDVDLESYIKNSFNTVLGDGYVSMIAFSSQKDSGGGQPEGADYNRVAESVQGLVKDVQASSEEYGEALKFLGEKVASQLSSSFKVTDVGPSQQITRVWYSSWFTNGKFVELKPTDYSPSASSFVITNPEIVEKMKNEAAFKFFVEIY